MAKVYVIIVKHTRYALNSNWTSINGVYKTLDAARQEIENIMNEYRSDDSITILGENWTLDEYPYYFVHCIENYYVKHDMMDYKEHIEYLVEEFEMAE